MLRAHLCTLGYAQIPGIDHQDNFAPVVMDSTFRLSLMYVMKMKKVVRIVNIVTVFLYGGLKDQIYVEIPKGLKEYFNKTFQDQCAIMKKSAYGPVQAVQQHYKKMYENTNKRDKFWKISSLSVPIKERYDHRVTLI